MEKSESVFTLTPMTQKLRLQPGEVREGVITVINPVDAKEPFAYKVTVAPYGVMGANYEVDLTTRTERSRMVDWITIDEPLGTVLPNESKEIHYTIRVPEDAPAGGQYAAIMVGSDERDVSSHEGEMSIKNIYEMASVLYAQVNGNIIRKGGVMENKVPGFVTATPITTTVRITNEGNVHETAKIKVKVKNFLTGTQIYPAEEQEGTTEEILMPETERLVMREISEIPAVGIFEVTQTVEYLGETYSSPNLVIACPIWLMAMMAVTIGVVVAGIVMAVRRRCKRGVVI